MTIAHPREFTDVEIIGKLTGEGSGECGRLWYRALRSYVRALDGKPTRRTPSKYIDSIVKLISEEDATGALERAARLLYGPMKVEQRESCKYCKGTGRRMKYKMERKSGHPVERRVPIALPCQMCVPSANEMWRRAVELNPDLAKVYVIEVAWWSRIAGLIIEEARCVRKQA